MRRVLVVWRLGRAGYLAVAGSAEARLAKALADEAAGHEVVEDADRLAWAVYRGGDMRAAEAWLGKVYADPDLARWIRAKLLLRAGKLDQAAALFARIAPQPFILGNGQEPRRRTHGNDGVIPLRPYPEPRFRQAVHR